MGGAPNKIQTKLACILEADESMRMRMGNSIPPNHEDTTIWFTNLFYASSYENSGSESSGGQGMRKIGENFGVEPDESQK